MLPTVTSICHTLSPLQSFCAPLTFRVQSRTNGYVSIQVFHHNMFNVEVEHIASLFIDAFGAGPDVSYQIVEQRIS